MSGTKQSSVNSLKPGSYLVIDGVACRVNKIETSRPGKHGHAKCRIDASSLVDGGKKVVVLPGHDKIEVPIIDKKTAQVLSVQGDIANIMDEENYETFDVKIPEELKGKIEAGISVVYWDILGDRVLKQIK
jgi:translation initiation factor 5A